MKVCWVMNRVMYKYVGIVCRKVRLLGVFLVLVTTGNKKKENRPEMGLWFGLLCSAQNRKEKRNKKGSGWFIIKMWGPFRCGVHIGSLGSRDKFEI